MLKIAINAFKNCRSLKEFHFEKINEIPDFNSKFNDGISNNYVVIVKNKLYDDWFKYNFEIKLLKESSYIKEQINNLKNSKILVTINLLSKTKKLLINTDFSKILSIFIEKLIKKYNIQQNDINKFENLNTRKNKYESK